MIVDTLNNKDKISPEERIKILAISRIKGFGPRRFINCISKFGTIDNLLKEKKKSLKKFLPGYIVDDLKSKRFLRDIDEYIKELDRKETYYSTLFEPNYPRLLREIYDPPIVLYSKKAFTESINLDRCFSVVGTRGCSKYGIEVTKKMVRRLVELDFTIVSGMAFGIDKAAHTEAIKESGKTVAVLSSSVNIPSPMTNIDIYRNILSNGGSIFSERHLGDDIVSGMFPARNRIISGLSIGTLIVEAGKKSGALITARLALEQGREVFAIPANIYNSKGIGTNNLIKKSGAKLVQDVDDIVEELGISFNNDNSTKQLLLDDLEKKIVNYLYRGSATIDNISEYLNVDISSLNQKISILEIEGKVAKVEGNRYVVIK